MSRLQSVSLCVVAATIFPYFSARAQDIALATTANPELSFSVAFDGANNFLVGVRGDAQWNHAVGVQFVSTSGVVGAHVAIGHRGGGPYVAHGANGYLMVWDDDPGVPGADAVGALLDNSGTVLNNVFPIATSTHGGELAGVATDGIDFLVAYRPEPTTPGTGPIHARLVTSAGVVGPVIAVSASSTTDIGRNAVAFGNGKYVVVWSENPPLSTSVLGRLIDVSGVPGTTFTVDSHPSTPHDGAAVACNGASFLVAWSRDAGGLGAGAWDVYARQVSLTGTPLGAQAIVIDDSQNAQQYPCVGAGAGEFLVTWTDRINDVDGDFACGASEATCSDIVAQRISNAGAPIGPPFSIAHKSRDQYGSPLAFDGAKFLVAYSEGTLGTTHSDVYATFIDLAVTPAPAAYCTSQVNSLGCTPLITWSGSPSVSSSAAFAIEATNVRNQRSGLLFYGSTASAVAFQGGTRCVAFPVRRTGAQNSGGAATGNSCDGGFVFDFNAFVASGADASLVAGAVVRAQYWSRDPGAAPLGTNLSDALAFTLAP